MNRHYHHTQTGYVMLAALAIVACSIAYRAASTGEPRPSIIFLGIIVAILALFSTLTVTIAGGFITASFGPGLIRRRIALADIESFQPVRNPWYAGWGIRIGTRGYMFNVSGLDAVELKLTDGSIFRVGTDEPEALAGALKMAISLKP